MLVIFPNQRLILDEILPEAFAVVREVKQVNAWDASFDVQLIGGMVCMRVRLLK